LYRKNYENQKVYPLVSNKTVYAVVLTRSLNIMSVAERPNFCVVLWSLKNPVTQAYVVAKGNIIYTAMAVYLGFCFEECLESW
jgi:hypothetical protein